MKSKVVFSSGVESLANPRDTFKEVWRVLKPGGACFVSFTTKVLTTDDLKAVKMWTTMNDEQKIWIVGRWEYESPFAVYCPLLSNISS